MKQKPLLFIDPTGEVRRMRFQSGQQAIDRLLCPFRQGHCSANCTAIGLSNIKDDIWGLVCYRTREGFAIGILDPQTLDQDLFEAMKFGSDLVEGKL